MTEQWSLSQIMTRPTWSLEEQIRGSELARIFEAFVGTSALFPILDAIRAVATEGWGQYLIEIPHYILFLAVLIQAVFLGTAKSDTWQMRFMGNMLGFFIYAPLDITIEGFTFFTEPYHWLFFGFSLLIATLSAFQVTFRSGSLGASLMTILLNLSKILLFPAIYVIISLQLELASQLTTRHIWQDYMAESGHQFIFYGALFFGLLLGLAELYRLNYVDFLQNLSTKLKSYSEWSLDANLIVRSLDDPNALKLHRVEKTILFMDIRGFTAWTEQVDPQQAVEMLNQYYNTAEVVLDRYKGHKPNFTADEVMTRFTNPQTAFDAALDLQAALKPLLLSFNLAVGIGLHTGLVIEGLMGSDHTRKYDIIGDTVNTAKRLESAAGQGEVVISESTYQALTLSPEPQERRTLKVKGKAEALPVFAFR